VDGKRLIRYQSDNADVKFLLRSVDEAQYFACSLKKSIILCDVLDCVVVHMVFVEFFVSIFFNRTSYLRPRHAEFAPCLAL